MGIKWDAAVVLDCCRQADAELAKGLPHILRAAEILRHVKDVDNMPTYITQPAEFAANEVKWAGDRAKQKIDRVRSAVPEQEAARARFRGRMVPLIVVKPGATRREAGRLRPADPFEGHSFDGTFQMHMRLPGGRYRRYGGVR